MQNKIRTISIFVLCLSMKLFGQEIVVSQKQKEPTKKSVLDIVTRVAPLQKIIADYVGYDWERLASLERTKNLDNDPVHDPQDKSVWYITEESNSYKKVLAQYNYESKVITNHFIPSSYELDSCVTLSRDGKYMAFVGSKNITELHYGLVVLEKTTKAVIAEIPFNEAPHTLLFSPDSKKLFVAVGGHIIVWDTTNWRKPIAQNLCCHSHYIYALATSPHGLHHASAGIGDGLIKIHNTHDNTIINQLDSAENKSGVFCMTYSPDGHYLASGSYDGTIKIWDVTQKYALKSVITAFKKNRINSLAYSPDSKFLASTSFANKIKIWDTQTHSLSSKFTVAPHDNQTGSMVHGITYSPCGQYLFFALTWCQYQPQEKRTIEIWQKPTQLEEIE